MKPTSAKAHIVIYSRPGCHLCDEAKQTMEAAGCRNEYTLEEINIKSDPGLLRRYQFDIPVVTIDGVEAFSHRLTADAFPGEATAERGQARLPDLRGFQIGSITPLLKASPSESSNSS